MSISRRDTQSDISSGNSVTLTFGVDVDAGNVILLFVGCFKTVAVQTPSGYTLVGSTSYGPGSLGTRLYCFAKEADGTELTVVPTLVSSNNIAATSFVYSGTNLTWGTLMQATGEASSGRVFDGPTWGALPVADVAAVCALMCNTGASTLTSTAVSGSGWTERSDEVLDVGFTGGYLHCTATNTSESLAPCVFTMTHSTLGGTCSSLMIYIYESSGGKRSKLMMSL